MRYSGVKYNYKNVHKYKLEVSPGNWSSLFLTINFHDFYRIMVAFKSTNVFRFLLLGGSIHTTRASIVVVQVMFSNQIIPLFDDFLCSLWSLDLLKRLSADEFYTVKSLFLFIVAI